MRHVPSDAVLVVDQIRPAQGRMDTGPYGLESSACADAKSREKRFDLPAPA